MSFKFDETLENIIWEVPFQPKPATDWGKIADYLVRSLSAALDLSFEILTGREPQEYSYAPLIRCQQPFGGRTNVRVAGILSCAGFSSSWLRIRAVLFLFALGHRIAPSDRVFLEMQYRRQTTGNGEWSQPTWETSDFPEEWRKYTYGLFFIQ